MKRVLSIAVLLPLFLYSCGDQKIDTTAAREEMEAREIKVVSDAQILEQATKLGKELSAEFKVISSDQGIEFSFGKDTIYQKAHYLFGESNTLTGKELELFKAYDYNTKNGIASEVNVQKLDEGKTLLYNSPIQLGDSTIGIWSIKFSRKEIVLSIKN